MEAVEQALLVGKIMVLVHSSIYSEPLVLSLLNLCVREEFVGEFFLPPSGPDEMALVKVCSLGHLKPPTVLQDRPDQWEIVAISNKELEVCGLELRLGLSKVLRS